jgi:N-acetylglucosamine-6-sulfatase
MRQRTSRREFLTSLGVMVAVGLAGCACRAAMASTEAASKRNIVFILTDDQRFDAIGGFGNPFFETPQLDQLARNGIWFENAFVTTSLCSPSRASILTGLYAHKHRVLDNRTRLSPQLPTFPRELQKAGYETAFVGKWHMGGSSAAPRPGFDRWVSFRGQGVYTNPTFNVDGQTVKRKGYVTDLITDYAVDFIDLPHKKPFMLYISHKAVHADFQPVKRYKDKYKGKAYRHLKSMADTDANYRGKPDWVRRQRDSWHGVDGMYNKRRNLDTVIQQYAEALMALDESVGRIVRALTDRGLLESTLLVFTSDNGFLFGEHGLIDKRVMYEPSIRVPLIVHCPELFAGGQRREEMILNLDFAPTFLEVAGCTVPRSMQGRSFLGLLTGTCRDWRDDFLYEYFWERSYPQTPTVLGVRTQTHKLMQFHGVWDRYELYDLRRDPDEMHNLLGAFRISSEGGTLDRLIARRADGSVKAVYSDLRQRLRRLLEETGCAAEPRW